MADDLFGIVGTIQGGAFRVDEVVAEGGFAVVYRAYHSAFRSDVALKCLKIPRTLTEPEQAAFLEKFREEAELLFRLSSAIPSVVRPLQVGTLVQTGGRFVPFLALEWLDGETLDRSISNRVIDGKPPLELAVVVRMLTPVAGALCRAHKLPTKDGVVTIVHRDLKPENIFLADVHGKKLTKVLDFGIAKVKNAATHSVGKQSAAESPMAAFSPCYGAPEQWLPKRYGQTGPWTDVWGLALTAVEALCGHTPIDGDHAAMMGQAIDVGQRPTPRNEGVRVPDRVEAIFARALAVDPQERYQDVDTFWNDLCEAIGLPQVVGDRSPSLLPSSDDFGAPPEPRSPVPSPLRVPDLTAPVRKPSGEMRAVGPGRTSSGEMKAVVPVRKPSGEMRAVANKPMTASPEGLFGTTLEAPDDIGPALRLKTSVPPPPARTFEAPLSSPRPAVVARTTSAVVRPASPSIAKKLHLGAPLKLLALAMAMMGGDYAYAAAYGESFQIGPARVFWLAGPLAAIGSILLLTRLLSAED
ncbi:MAG TPA: protein kinase [Polyangiaceae bacterium]|jgi:serine/threonine-protein kinase|nr:protein kinase [Polyangiaceae bacterium]